jgi:hypothetical protein
VGIASDAVESVLSDDSPGERLDEWKDYSRHDIFHLYVMYRPTGGIWVPLREAQWDWSAHASMDDQGVWSLGLAGRGYQQLGSDCTTPPDWEGHFLDYTDIYIPA